MRMIHGVGINDADYEVSPKVNGVNVVCNEYKSWHSMMTRAYSKSYHSRCPTYIGVTVCDEWRSFMKFREWWMDHHVDGWHLDKDLISDGRIYSPDTCVYVPQWINKFIILRSAARGEWPIGVHYHKRDEHFRAQCCNPISGKKEVIGCFDDPINAHQAWKTRKLEIAFELKEKMDSIDLRIYQRVLEIINNAK